MISVYNMSQFNKWRVQMQIKYFNGEKSKNKFTAKDGIVFEPEANSFVLRITSSKNQTNSRVVMDEKLDEDFGKFIKPTKILSTGNGNANPQKDEMRIVTFNIPEEGIAYKAIFSNSHKSYSTRPMKIMSLVEGGKWTTVASPSKKLILQCQKAEDEIQKYYWSK